MRKRTAQLIEQQKESIAFQPKRKPRGKPFEKGNKIGNRFKPGESGNPGGLPGVNVSERIARTVLERYESQIIEGLGEALCKGNGFTFAIVADRADGKVKDRHEITGADGGPVEVTVRFVKGTKK